MYGIILKLSNFTSEERKIWVYRRQDYSEALFPYDKELAFNYSAVTVSSIFVNQTYCQE